MPRKSLPVRYAVVGLGYIAQIAVLPAFAHAKRNSRLRALVSSDSTKLAELGDRYAVDVRGGGPSTHPHAWGSSLRGGSERVPVRWIPCEQRTRWNCVRRERKGGWQRYARELSEIPRLNAFCRVAPSVLFSDRAIFFAGIFRRARVRSSRTSSLDHSRRLDRFLAMVSPFLEM